MAWGLCSRTFPKEDAADPSALPGARKAAGFGSGGAAQGSGVLGGSRSSSSPCRGSYCVFSLQALWFSEWDLLLGWEVAALPDVLIGDRQVRGSHARGVLGGHTGVSTPKHPTHSPCATPRIIPVRINPKLIRQVGMERVRPCSQPL